MAWIDDETSVFDSRPAEIYTIVAAGTTYRYTSFGSDFSFGGNTFTAIEISRSAIDEAGATDPRELVVEMSALSGFVQDCGFGIPPQEMTFLLQRVQQTSAEAKELWRGPVCGFTARAGRGKFRVPLLVDAFFDTEVPAVRFQALCPHRLFDNRCTVDEADFDQAATVSSISSDGKTITVSTVGGNPDGWFRLGRLKHNATSEQRRIVSQVGTAIEIDYPFRTIAATNAVTLFAGCDRKVVTCRDKFLNVDNFGGHPFIGVHNLWRRGLRGLF